MIEFIRYEYGGYSGGVKVQVIRLIVTLIYVAVCIGLVVIVLMQEGKSAGLTGAINGVADTYWGKNKGRSREANLVRLTKILAILFIVLAAVLNINKF